MYKRILLFFLLTLPLYSYSQRLLKDIASSDESSNINKSFTNFSNYSIKGDTLFFLAQDTTYKNFSLANIWFTNGTTATTKKITNETQQINSTESHTFLASFKGKTYYKYVANSNLYATDGNTTTIVKTFQNSTVRRAGVINGWLYLFVSNNNLNVLELWKTDGTEANTSKVTDIYTGWHNFNLSSFLNTGDKIYFTFSNNNYGTEPWVTDGSAAGTKILKDLIPGPSSSYPESFEKIGNTVFFFAYLQNQPLKLWKTDGTEAGTVLVAETIEGTSFYMPRSKISYGNQLYFMANHSNFYKTDGHTVTLVQNNLYIPNNSLMPSDIVKMNNLMYFIRINGPEFELWKSDGSTAGTQKIKSILSSPKYNNISVRILAGTSKIYFQLSASGLLGIENITQHWVSDGTANGTININTLNPNFSTGSYTNQLTVVGNTYYFTAYDAINGFELWKTDGTSLGTFMVKNINKTVASSEPSKFVALNNDVYFLANDIKHGREIWKTDGTEANTKLVIDFNASDVSNINYSSEISGMIVYNDVIIAQIALQLVKFNQNTPPTAFFASTLQNPVDPEFTKFANKIFFKGWNRYNSIYELFHTDGNTVYKVAYWAGENPSNLMVWNGFLYFSTDNNTQIWKTDGTVSGTVLVKEFSAGTIQSKFYEVNGVLMFSYESPTYGLELWKTDGTEAGTEIVKDINPGPGSSYIYNMVVYNNKLFFNAYDTSGRYKLYQSDGTSANTNVFSSKLSLTVPKVAKNKLFFINYDPVNNAYWLCATDGITDPVNIKKIGDNTIYNAHNTTLTSVNNNLLVFDVIPNSSRHELWVSDGTTAGTKMMKVIREKHSNDEYLHIKEYFYHNNKLYFAADDGVHGKELWVWDFTCPEFMTLNNSISQDSVFTVDKYIVGNNKINTGVKVEYNANKYVTLSPGFETKAGSRFTASMNGCINLTQSANTISNTNEPIFKNQATKTDSQPSIVQFLNSPLNTELLTVYLAEADKGNEQNIAWIIDETTDKYILKMRVNEKEYIGYLPK